MNILSRLNRLIHKKQSMFVLVDILETTKSITMQFYIHNEDEVFFKTVSKSSVQRILENNTAFFPTAFSIEETFDNRPFQLEQGKSRVEENLFVFELRI